MFPSHFFLKMCETKGENNVRVNCASLRKSIQLCFCFSLTALSPSESLLYITENADVVLRFSGKLTLGFSFPIKGVQAQCLIQTLLLRSLKCSLLCADFYEESQSDHPAAAAAAAASRGGAKGASGGSRPKCFSKSL